MSNITPTPQLVRLTDLQARAVYEILCIHCDASRHPQDMDSFVYEFTGDKPTSEYRFQGGLGFGGKFRFPRMSVDFYPEDKTPSREQMAASANTALASLKAEFEAETVRAAEAAGAAAPKTGN